MSELAEKRTPMRVSAETARRIAATDHAALARDGNYKAGRNVPPKFKAAVTVMLTQPKVDLEAAAKAVGIGTYLLRRYLNQAQNRAYLREQKKILVEAIAAGNPVALKDVRDNSGNAVARVNAARALELMHNEMDEPGYRDRYAPQSPGVTIVFTLPDGSQTPHPPTIDVTPTPELEAGVHAWPSTD